MTLGVIIVLTFVAISVVFSLGLLVIIKQHRSKPSSDFMKRHGLK